MDGLGSGNGANVAVAASAGEQQAGFFDNFLISFDAILLSGPGPNASGTWIIEGLVREELLHSRELFCLPGLKPVAVH